MKTGCFRYAADWTYIGTATNNLGAGGDHHPTIFTLPGCVQYVKLVDITNPNLHTAATADIFDVDAVCSSDTCAEKTAWGDGTGYDHLTAREQEIMALLAQGLSNKQIAEKLFISPKTVENHRSNILRKLNIHSTIELVRYAARLGIIDVDLWKG